MKRWIEGEVVPVGPGDSVLVPASTRNPKLIRAYGDLNWISQSNPQAPAPLTEDVQIFVRGVYVVGGKGGGQFIASTKRLKEKEDE